MCTIMVDGKHQIMKCTCSPSPTLPKNWGDREGNWQTKTEPGEKETEFKRKRQTLKMKWGERVVAGRRGQCIHWCLARFHSGDKGHRHIRGLDSDPED